MIHLLGRWFFVQRSKVVTRSNLEVPEFLIQAIVEGNRTRKNFIEDHMPHIAETDSYTGSYIGEKDVIIDV